MQDKAELHLAKNYVRKGQPSDLPCPTLILIQSCNLQLNKKIKENKCPDRMAAT